MTPAQEIRQAAERLSALADQADKAERWCPDLVRPGCSCSRCRAFGPALTWARAINVTERSGQWREVWG